MIQKDDYNKKPTGTLKMIMHKGGTYNIETGKIENGKIITQKEIKNIIVTLASNFLAMRMAPGSKAGQTSSGTYIPGITDGEYNSSGLKYLAVGTGPLTDNTKPYNKDTNRPKWDLLNPPTETVTQTHLNNEVFRKKFTDWKFLDTAGNLSSIATNVLLLSTTFLENEANAPLMELGLFGGTNVNSSNGEPGNNNVSDTKDTGLMFNYKTFAAWTKDASSRITIIYKITF